MGMITFKERINRCQMINFTFSIINSNGLLLPQAHGILTQNPVARVKALLPKGKFDEGVFSAGKLLLAALPQTAMSISALAFRLL